MTSKPFKIKHLLSFLLCFLGIISCKSDVKNIQKVEQKMATFYTDLAVSPQGTNGEWRINGQKMTWDSKPISVVPNQNALDTIFFTDDNVRWDTIICKIQSADSISFRYNDCCGGFNVFNKSYVYNKTRKSSELNVVFNLESRSTEQYLGTIGMAGILAKHKSRDTLQQSCGGAMASNVKHIELLAINKCKDTTNCKESVICFYPNPKNKEDNSFLYNEKKKLISFLYVPLQEEVLKVNYDPKTGKTTLKID
jgi:hypothetical protein